MRKYGHLTQFERDRIEAMKNKGHTQEEIAKVLKRDESTVSREIKKRRKKDGIYDAAYAQHLAYVKRRYAKYQGKKIVENDELRKYIINGLAQCWNPDEISGRMKYESQLFYSSKTAIYEWLRSSWGQAYCPLLPSKQYHSKKRKDAKTAGREMIPNRIGIESLPADFGLDFGDFETDTVVSGKKTGGKTALTVLQDIRAHYTRLEQIPNLKPKVNENAVGRMIDDFNAARCILRDNGREGKCHEQTPTPSIFCDPYSSWQKPHVENTNKLLRRFFPKGCDLGKYSQSYVHAVESIINNKPRKCLGYKKPIEIVLEAGLLRNPPKGSRLAVTFNRPLVALRG
jgi:transposase, IS30 family